MSHVGCFLASRSERGSNPSLPVEFWMKCDPEEGARTGGTLRPDAIRAAEVVQRGDRRGGGTAPTSVVCGTGCVEEGSDGVGTGVEDNGGACDCSRLVWSPDVPRGAVMVARLGGGNGERSRLSRAMSHRRRASGYVNASARRTDVSLRSVADLLIGRCSRMSRA